MKMTRMERKFFKEKVIRDYKLKHEKPPKKNVLYNRLLRRLKTIMPLSIAIGLVASLFLVYFVDLRTLIQLLISGVIWLTLITTVVSALLKSG
jgi:hypothetical protein